ncbi:helix-turn-helix transcriptional regulator [Streptomyces sp. NPDC050549]|uniref:PadR family transcriptional regulator n=1 Tax=Streptomyces sp. NPDC050549 TaxID=3155406 RepID=UPI00343C5C38
MTLQTQLVLRALLEDPARQRYGLELCELAGLPSGTIYPILARLEQFGWLESSWEDPAVHEVEGRPRRRFYGITQDGAEEAREALARTYRSRKQPLPGWVSAHPAAEGEAS